MSETTPTEEEAAAQGGTSPAENAVPAEATMEPGQAEELAQAEEAMVAEGGTPAEDEASASDAAEAPETPEGATGAKGPPNLSPAACAALLAQHFPALFGAGRALPIKLRVQGDIQLRVPGVFNKKSLSIFLHRYTTSTAYLKALASAPQRLDLDGAPAGEIDVVHREAAAAEVQRRKQMFEDRRAVEREQQRLAAQETRRAQQQQNNARHAARDNAEADARRNRATLLRAFETTTLTRANFCALKGLVEADLDGQLAQAKQERDQRAQEPKFEPRFEPRNDRPRNDRPRADRPRGDRPPQQRPRGPRPPGKPPVKPQS